ncbi:class I SAM-dependent methyltransferase [Kutzneria sp. CA-103260]|uniref:class I SAM-dependent methyltransferase n=1 Tax=Kutzneria sp. CA-103260 TaxID=2802641 RepID=UPI001BAD3C98|nr:SAM-dependent methyltransferase [Kutzneria sp. CA-103260]QUQ67281.1 methyltransferase, family protein [Kutzneria sp. CA-103260]
MTQLDQVALTGRLTAALRARESARPDRLFTDPHAAVLAGEDGLRLLADFGDNSTISVRTKWLDDRLTRLRPAQLVIVAAGMDSRAWRLDVLSDALVYELDRPEVLDLKASLIDASPVGPRRPVGVDLAGDWAPALLAAGFDPAAPTVWTVEGLTQYLHAADVSRLLDGITALSADGSHLLIDLVGQSLLDSAAMKPMLDRFAAMDMTWRFGTDNPEELLGGRGWSCEVSLFGSVGNDYGRWPYPEVPRGTPGVGQGYLVHARR